MIKDIDSPSFARDVSRRNNRGRRALVFKSQKSQGGDLRVESALERDIGIMLDIDPRVMSLAAQPFSLELQSNEVLPSRRHHRPRPGTKPRFYTPDFLCRLDDGSALAIEVKHSRFAEAFEAKREEIKSGLHQHGMNFMVVTDKAVSPTVMQVLSRLHHLRAGYLESTRAIAQGEISALLDTRSDWVSEELALHLTSGGIGVLAGLLAGLLTTDLSIPLFSSTSTVRAANGDLSHLQILGVYP